MNEYTVTAKVSGDEVIDLIVLASNPVEAKEKVNNCEIKCEVISVSWGYSFDTQ
jgi:hypothetical protein